MQGRQCARPLRRCAPVGVVIAARLWAWRYYHRSGLGEGQLVLGLLGHRKVGSARALWLSFVYVVARLGFYPRGSLLNGIPYVVLLTNGLSTGLTPQDRRLTLLIPGEARTLR